MIFVLPALSCRGEPNNMMRTLPVAQIRDSSGVRLIEYPNLGPMPTVFEEKSLGPAVPQLTYLPKIELEASPFLLLGGPKKHAEEEFDPGQSPLQVVELSDGTLVVLDMYRLLFFDANGKLARIAGRRGQGPGEFSQTRWICVIDGDSLMVRDTGGRTTIWSAEGQHVRTVGRLGFGPLGECDQTGGIVIGDATQVKLVTSGDQPVERLINYRSVNAAGSTIRNFGFQPSTELGEAPPQPVLIPLRHGFIFGNGRTYEIRQYDDSARLVRVTRLLQNREPISDEQWENSIFRSVPRGASRAESASVRASVARLRRPDRYPAYSQMRRDFQGRIWVSDYAFERSWTVFDSMGVIVGRFENYNAVAGIGRKFIALKVRDQEGTLAIQFFRIRKDLPSR